MTVVAALLVAAAVAVYFFITGKCTDHEHRVEEPLIEVNEKDLETAAEMGQRESDFVASESDLIHMKAHQVESIIIDEIIEKLKRLRKDTEVRGNLASQKKEGYLTDPEDTMNVPSIEDMSAVDAQTIEQQANLSDKMLAKVEKKLRPVTKEELSLKEVDIKAEKVKNDESRASTKEAPKHHHHHHHRSRRPSKRAKRSKRSRRKSRRSKRSKSKARKTKSLQDARSKDDDEK